MAGGSARQLRPYQFKPGQTGNPAGRPKGSRQKLQELAVALLHEDFAEHGKDVIERVRKNKPEVYLASVVSLLPKRTEKIDSPLVDISDDELAQLEQHLREIRAKSVSRLLELDPDATVEQPKPRFSPSDIPQPTPQTRQNKHLLNQLNSDLAALRESVEAEVKLASEKERSRQMVQNSGSGRNKAETSQGGPNLSQPTDTIDETG
jgi:Family of unknown function (DUF5681)